MSAPSTHLSVADVRELLGDDAEGLSDDQLMWVRVETEELAQMLLQQFRDGARAPNDFVPSLDAQLVAAKEQKTCRP